MRRNACRLSEPPQTLNFQASSLRQMVEQVLAPNIQNYRNSGITVTLEFDENLPLVQLDQEKIKQVILNLSKNAVEAMPKGGFLTVRGHLSSAYVALEFNDTGEGRSEERR